MACQPGDMNMLLKSALLYTHKYPYCVSFFINLSKVFARLQYFNFDT